MIIRPEWDAPHVRCLPRTFCAWPCLLRQVGTVLGSSCDCIVTGITYANPGSRHERSCRAPRCCCSSPYNTALLSPPCSPCVTPLAFNPSPRAGTASAPTLYDSLTAKIVDPSLTSACAFPSTPLTPHTYVGRSSGV